MPKRLLGGVKISRRQLERLMADIRRTMDGNSIPEFEFRICLEGPAVILNMHDYYPDKEGSLLLSRSLGMPT